MKKRIILIPKDDLVYYPPTISLIRVLVRLGATVECVGIYSDKAGQRMLEEEGVKFIPIYRKLKDESRFRVINWINIVRRMRRYTSEVRDYLNSVDISNTDLIWFVFSNSIGSLQKTIERFPYVIQFYEFEDFSLGGRSRILHPNYNAFRFLSSAKVLVHCEYNRAMITNGLYGLKQAPVILPNKPFEYNGQVELAIPADIQGLVADTKRKIDGRKVILYQGIFNPSERRLEEFCESISLLPEDYVFLAMGGGGGYFDEIKRKYTSNRIVFIPFVKPPYHLEITKLADYGILTYHPNNQTYVGVINPLYCAPNKIFEYGRFGIPMIANDVPGLKMIFETYQCGKTITSPITPEKIAQCVLEMNKNYEKMRSGARAYYDSIDLENLVKTIIDKASDHE